MTIKKLKKEIENTQKKVENILKSFEEKTDVQIRWINVNHREVESKNAQGYSKINGVELSVSLETDMDLAIRG